MRRARLPIVLLLGALAIAGIAYGQPPSGISRPSNESSVSQLELGAELYAGNCASCHGVAGRGILSNTAHQGAGGIRGRGPSLRGVGAQAADLYLRTGFMPLSNPGEKPYRRRVLFSDREIRALVAYVASLAPGPGIPHVDPAAGSVSEGFQLFTEHCAGCHQSVAEGGYVTDTRVPPIKQDTPTQVAEAVRTGPYLMPKFSQRQISDAELNSIVAYVQASKHPEDRGGWGLGHLGPVPEGMVAWAVAGIALVGLCVLIGERVKA
jgi:ubiquinol-cytochrome c reductase cytochrome c subunit